MDMSDLNGATGGRNPQITCYPHGFFLAVHYRVEKRITFAGDRFQPGLQCRRRVKGPIGQIGPVDVLGVLCKVREEFCCMRLGIKACQSTVVAFH